MQLRFLMRADVQSITKLLRQQHQKGRMRAVLGVLSTTQMAHPEMPQGAQAGMPEGVPWTMHLSQQAVHLQVMFDREHRSNVMYDDRTDELEPSSPLTSMQSG